MSFDYTQSAATAQRLLARFGKAITVRKQQAGAYDPATSSVSINNVDTVAQGVLLEYKDGQANAPGTMIQVGDKKLLLSPANFSADPIASDLVLADGATWNIVKVKALRPAGVTVLYELQLRRA